MSDLTQPADIDYVPAWYPRLRRRRRSAMALALMCGTLLAVSASAVFTRRASVRAAEASFAADSKQLFESRQDVARLDRLLKLRADLARQRQVIAGLGVKVEPTRLLSSLESAMPADVSLLSLSLSTDEPTEAAAPTPLKLTNSNRHLAVRLQGTAPSDLQLADLLNRLSAVQCFQQVAMTYARDRIDEGRILREFEVVFRIDLDVAGVTQ